MRLGAPLGPGHSHHASSRFYGSLSCRVYVKHKCAQCLPLSDNKEVGQEGDPAQPRLSCVCVSVCKCICEHICTYVWACVVQCVICFLPMGGSLTSPVSAVSSNCVFLRLCKRWLRSQQSSVWCCSEQQSQHSHVD